MKKIMTMFLIILMLATVLCGCGGAPTESDESTHTNTTADATPEVKVDISKFREVAARRENIDIYRTEVSTRLSSSSDTVPFISDAEWNVISNHFGSETILNNHNTYITVYDKKTEKISEYYYPIVFKIGDSLLMWYTSADTGGVFTEPLYGDWKGLSYISMLHTDLYEPQIFINSSYVLAYTQDTGKVRLWELGKNTKTYDVPEDSNYCGFSELEGYIFRDGNDVYALKAEGTINANGSLVCIAHKVKQVINASYYYDEDYYAQPVFLMSDGMLLAYLGDLGFETHSDSLTHLFYLDYEGSARGVIGK